MYVEYMLGFQPGRSLAAPSSHKLRSCPQGGRAQRGIPWGINSQISAFFLFSLYTFNKVNFQCEYFQVKWGAEIWHTCSLPPKLQGQTKSQKNRTYGFRVSWIRRSKIDDFRLFSREKNSCARKLGWIVSKFGTKLPKGLVYLEKNTFSISELFTRFQWGGQNFFSVFPKL